MRMLHMVLRQLAIQQQQLRRLLSFFEHLAEPMSEHITVWDVSEVGGRLIKLLALLVSEVDLGKLEQHIRVLPQSRTGIEVELFFASQTELAAAIGHVDFVVKLSRVKRKVVAELENSTQVPQRCEVLTELHAVDCHLVVAVDVAGLHCCRLGVCLESLNLVVLHEQHLAHLIVDV